MAPELIGRVQDVAAGRRFLQAAATSPAGLVIEGDPGIGKTLLWQAIVDDARAEGRRVLVSRPTESDAALSFAALTDLLGPVADELLPLLPPPQRQALEVTLLRASSDRPVDVRALSTGVHTLVDVLAAHERVVFAIDDAQWLDAATGRVLQFAMRRVRAAPVGLLANRRPHAGGSVIEGWLEPERVEVRALGPMSLGALHRLIEQRFGNSLARPALRHLEHASGGNPLLAIEIVDAVQRAGGDLTAQMILPVPADLARLVSGRVSSLPPATRRLVATVAALGRADVDTLGRAEATDDVMTVAALAMEAGLLTLEDGRFRFAHPLYRSAVYGAESESARRQLHKRLARVVVGREEAARHLAMATPRPSAAAADEIAAAATEAQHRGALDAAADLLGDAIRLTPPDDASGLAQRTLARARVLWDAGDLELSRRLVRDVLATGTSGSTRVAAVLLDGMHVLWSEGPAPAIRRLGEALQGASAEPVLEAIVRLRIAYASDDDLSLAREHATAAVRLLEGEGGQEDLLACALLMGAEARLLAGDGLDEAAIDRGRELLRGPPQPTEPVTALPARNVARERSWLLRLAVDEIGAAREELLQLRRDDAEHGLDRSAPIALSDLAELSCMLGDIEGARSHAEEAQELVRQTGATPYAEAAVMLAHALVTEHEGDLGRAEAHAAKALQLAQGLGPGELTNRVRVALGRIALQRDRPGVAVTQFELVDIAQQRAGVRHPNVLRVRGDHVEALVVSGRSAEAQELIDRFEADVACLPTPWGQAILARSRALAHAASGSLDAAAMQLEAAIGHHADLPMPVELGRTLLLLGRVRRRQRQKRSALDAFGRAEATFSAAGALGWVAVARREIARAGRRPGALDELTTTEHEVARLAATGMSIRQVADALVLSPKSIDGALTRVYAKLGIHSRAELGAWIERASVEK